MCKFCAILHKGLEHLQIWVASGGLDPFHQEEGWLHLAPPTSPAFSGLIQASGFQPPVAHHSESFPTNLQGSVGFSQHS